MPADHETPRRDHRRNGGDTAAPGRDSAAPENVPTAAVRVFTAPGKGATAAVRVFPAPGKGATAAARMFPAPGKGATAAARVFLSPGKGATDAASVSTAPGKRRAAAARGVPATGEGATAAASEFPARKAPECKETSFSAPAATHADALLTLLEDKPTDTPAELLEKASRRNDFTMYEMDAGFVAALRADRDALDAANTGKHTDNQEGLEATAAIATLLNKANAAVTRLHGPIHNKYAADPDKIHAWKQASRIESDPAPPEPDPVPPTP